MYIAVGNMITSSSQMNGAAASGGGGGGFSNTYSLAFDGTDDYISLDEVVYSSTFSFSFWIKPSSVSTKAILGDISNNSNFVRLDSTTSIKFKCAGGAVTFTESSGNDLVLDSWQHIIIIRDSSNNVTAFRNGTAFGSSSSRSGNFTLNSIGIAYQAGGWFFNGNIDELAIWNSDQTANIGSIYSASGAVDLTSLNPTAWWRMGDNGSYKSPQWLIPENSNKDKVSNYSFAFDGVGDNINLGTSVLDGLGAFSISFWFNTSYNDWQYFMGDNSFRFTMKQSTDDVRINFNGSAVYRADPLPVTLNTWNNFIFVFDGSLPQADRMKLYLNGSLATNILGGTPDTTFVANNNFRLARVGSYSAKLFVGMMDDVAFFNTALTSENVTSIYNSGEPTTLPSGKVAHYKMGEEATFSTNWTIPDGVGSADGLSENMTIEDRVGEAPNITLNALSYNMTESDREENVPS